jgi:hypothetical protein
VAPRERTVSIGAGKGKGGGCCQLMKEENDKCLDCFAAEENIKCSRFITTQFSVRECNEPYASMKAVYSSYI